PLTPPPPPAPLFPYTTLFRSHAPVRRSGHRVETRGLDARLDDDVAGRVAMHRRCICRQGCLGVDQRRRFLDLDGDEARVKTASLDRKSTRLNSSHLGISYAVF